MEVQLLLCQLRLALSISTQEPPFVGVPRYPISLASHVHTTAPFLFVMTKTRIPRVMRLASELTPSSPILRNQTFSPNGAVGFLCLRKSILSSLVVPP